MKYTLLELTQAVLSSMDSDEINSINDTVESLQVVDIIKSVYYDIVYRANLPEHYTIVSLESSQDNAKPVLMYLPSTVTKVEWVKYDKRLETIDPVNMEDVELLSLEDFLNFTYRLNPDDDNIESFTHTLNGTDFTFYYQTDTAPSFYTTFDDSTLVFNSLDTSLDTTLQKSKSMCLARLIPTFTKGDSFTPDLDAEQFTLLLNEAKSLAWAELRQSSHGIADRNSRRAWIHMQKNKSTSETLSDFKKLPNFGRK